MTKDEKSYQSKVAALGCIACRLDGIENMQVSIHHCNGRVKSGCEMQVLALCGQHHQTGGEQAPAIHPFKRRFEAKYGSQEYLMQLTADWINDGALP